MLDGASLGEVRAGLAEASDRLQAAYGCVRIAEQRLAEALAVLSELNRSHQGQLVPRELLAAGQELSRLQGMIMGGAESVSGIQARL